MRAILLIIFMFGTVAQAQDTKKVYTDFGPAEHLQNEDAYKTVEVDGQPYKKAILMFDHNFNIEEIQKANQAAKELGKVLVLVPRMSWSDRMHASNISRTIDDLSQKIFDQRKLVESTADPTIKAELQKKLDELSKEYKENNDYLDKLVHSEEYTLGKKNFPAILENLKKDGYAVDTLVVAAHTSGTDHTGEDRGDLQYWGDYEDLDNSPIQRKDLVEFVSQNKDKPAFSSLNHVYISGCNALTPYEAKKWMNGVPQLQSCTGYLGQAGLGKYPSMQSAMNNELVRSELFYQNLMGMNHLQQEDEMFNQLKEIQGENFAFLNLAKTIRNPDGSLVYVGQDDGDKIKGSPDYLAKEEESEICQSKAHEIVKDYAAEFLEAKNKLTMYKLAWTTLALSGYNNNDEIKSLETVLNKSIKDFDEKVNTNEEYKKQYEKLLAYESPYKTKWMTKGLNYLPNAIEVMARNMHSDDFRDKVLLPKYKGDALLVSKVQYDMKKYGVDYSDAKTTELMHDLYKNDKYANNFLSNYSTQITSAMRGRGGLKANDQLFYKKEIDKLNQKFKDLNGEIFAKLDGMCGETQADFVDIYSNSACKVKDPTNFDGLLTFKPLLEKLSLNKIESNSNRAGHTLKLGEGDDQKEITLPKEYLKVSRMKPECNFTFNDSDNPIVSFKDIPKTGEYHIAYIGKSGKDREKVLEDLKAMKGITSYKKKNEWFQNYINSNQIYTRKVLKDEVNLSLDSSGTSAKVDLDQSHIDSKTVVFDNGKTAKISKEQVDDYIVISSWGNNKRQINCKEGEVLNPDLVNPIRAEKIAEQKRLDELKKLEELKKKQLELQNMLAPMNTVAVDNTYVHLPIVDHNLNYQSIRDQINFQNKLNLGQLIDYDQVWQEEVYNNGLTNSTKIRKFHEAHPSEGDYLVVEKEAGRIALYNKDGFLKELINVEFVADKGDYLPGTEDPDGNKYNTIPAGIFEIDRIGKSSSGSGNDILFLKDQRGNVIKTAIRDASTNPSCTNCIKVPHDKMNLVLGHLKSDSNVYILPENKDNYFMLKNENIQFTTSEKGIDYGDYNFSPKDKTYHENNSVIKGKFTYQVIDNKEVLWDAIIPGRLLWDRDVVDKDVTVELANSYIPNEFMKTLDREKKKLMEMYNLDNDDYNQLAKLAFGILGNESEFGYGVKYQIKENNQTGVTTAKVLKDNWNNLDFYTAPITGDFSGVKFPSTNSRGLTQMKTIPTKIADQYGTTKNDLSKPCHAAVATMGLLAEKYQTLKRLEQKHPDITPTNRFDYLPYLYYGASREITGGTATPEQNIYVKNVKRYADTYLTIYQTKDPVVAGN